MSGLASLPSPRFQAWPRVPQPCVLAWQGEPCEPCPALFQHQEEDSHVVALPGPPGKKGEPGPPGFGLPGKHVSSGARGGGMLAEYVERGAGAAWITRLPSQWGADGSVKRGWCLCPLLWGAGAQHGQVCRKNTTLGLDRSGFKVQLCLLLAL